MKSQLALFDNILTHYCESKPLEGLSLRDQFIQLQQANFFDPNYYKSRPRSMSVGPRDEPYLSSENSILSYSESGQGFNSEEKSLCWIALQPGEE